jgi:hypothetical protein
LCIRSTVKKSKKYIRARKKLKNNNNKKTIFSSFNDVLRHKSF